MLDNFHEIRLRGKFIRIEEDNDDGTENSMVLSRWHYKLQVIKPTHIIIGVN
jgi:hypothetical protein